MAKNTKESDVVLNFRMNGEVAYSKTIKEINNDMKLAKLEYQNQVSAMDKNASASEKLAAAKQKLEKQLDIAAAKTEALREEYAKSAKETGENSEKTRKLYEMLLKSETSENNLRKALQSTNDALDAQGNKALTTAEKLEKIEKAAEKVKSAGEKLSVGVTAPVVAMATAGAKAYNDLSTAQTELQASFGLTEKEAKSSTTAMENIFADGLVENIDEAKEAVIKMINQFPDLKNQGSDAIQSMTEKALTLEKLFDADMDETLRGANALVTAYGYDGSEAMDLITTATQNGLDKTHELGDNLAEYATLFHQSGYSAEEMFSILEAGLDGGAYNLDKVNDLVKEFGIRMSDGTVKDAVGDLGGDFSNLYKQIEDGNLSSKDAFQLLSTEISKMSSEQDKAAAISAIFGTQGEDAGIQVIEAMSGATDAIEKNKQAYDDAAGSSDNLTNKVKETVTYQSAMNNMMLAAAEVGEQLAPTINSVAEAVKNAAQWFRGLDENTQKTIMTIAGIAAVVGPLLVVLGSVAGSITKIATAASGFLGVWTKVAGFLGLSGGAFALVVAGIALLIAGLVLAYNKVEWFRNGVNAFFQGVSDVAVEVFNFIGGYISGVFEGIWTNVSNVFEAGKRIFTGFIDFITGVFTGDWERAWNGIVNIFGGIFDGIVAIAKMPLNNMIGLINGFIRGLNNIKVPKWVPGVGGKGFSISTIPYLAEGGHVLNGQAIVGEAGPELLSNKNGKTTVTPLSDEEKRKGIGGKVQPTKVEQHIHIGNVDANNPSELNKMNRKFYRASKQALAGVGG
ncbi:phage tail tape measure protein [Enterococcus casseliflavus]|uniref:phage tail tape measure protein n=1 Tax=Enterococcus casseliflavus TaxID=37734 RepID=UPI001AD66F2E|nr:phage tail tape measure protein [Enterococcus casseliflavus]MBO6384346.1 phage tail tape measure protein [Enterococcus casseliflavus]